MIKYTFINHIYGLWYHDLLVQISYLCFMVFKYENVINFILIMYRYCKSYKWFIDMEYIDEYGFTRTCLWMKGYYGILRFRLHRTQCVIVCPRLEYGCCVLRLRGGSHLQNPYPCMRALWGRIIVHICLWGVSMVLWDDGLWGWLLVCKSYGYFSLVLHGQILYTIVRGA